ncbi:DUF6531 domain-containing protein [Roseateles sp. MS654]|uniref:DUF6531 domain-containing protein n=1 Tax=Roseateles sp. MS654 TaxID=3412685 RepID=UPI003C2D63D5
MTKYSNPRALTPCVVTARRAWNHLLLLVGVLLLLPSFQAVAAPTEYWRYYHAPTSTYSSAQQGVPYTYADAVWAMQYFGYGFYTGYRCAAAETNFNSGSTPVAPGTLALVNLDPNGVAYAIPMHLSGCTIANTNPPQAISDRYSYMEPLAKVVCRPGYSVSTSISGGGATSTCVADAVAAQAVDTANEQGPPLNCDDCTKSWLASIAPNSISPDTRRGKPVNAASGNEHFVQTDYAGAGGNLLAFERLYNSGVGFSYRNMAPGWTHNYAYRAVFAGANEPVTLVRPDGSSFTFVKNSGGVWVGPAYLRGSLSVAVSGAKVSSVLFTRGDGTKEQYGNQGSITSIAFGQGGTLTFSGSELVTAVSDGRGHTLSFTFGAAAGATRLTKVTDQAGTAISYGYDTLGRLTSVAYPGGAVRQYGYLGSTSKLTTVVDENGSTYASIAYDTTGRATSTQLGAGVDLTTFSYGAGSTTVTYASGLTETMSFGSPTGKPMLFGSYVCGSAGCGSGSLADQYDYDSNGNVASITNRQGVATCFSHATGRNLPSLVVDGISSAAACPSALSTPPATSRVTTYQWHALFDVPMAIASPQKKVLFNYDSVGRMLTQTEVETNDANGSQGLSAQAVGTARTTTYTYNAQGSVLTMKEPRSDVNATTTYAYDGNQNLVSITDPVGLVTTLGNYDSQGRPGLVTAPTGLQTSLTYDARGRLTQVASGGAVTTYGYDATGLLVSSTLPTGVSLTFTYDAAHRLVRTQDSLGNRIDRVLDNVSNVLQETVTGNGGAVALSQQAAYDQLSRITSLTVAP